MPEKNGSCIKAQKAEKNLFLKGQVIFLLGLFCLESINFFNLWYKYNNRLCRKIRQILNKKEKITPNKLQELFARDRREHLNNLIIPSLKKGKIVISDRYFFSSFAYGSAQGLSLNRLIKMNKNFLLPDLTAILKVRPEVCLRRIHQRGKEKTLFENKEKLIRVYQRYKNLTKNFKNIKLINGEKPINEVFARIKKILSKLV